MIVDIDIEGLKAKRATLEAQIRGIDDLLELAQKFGKVEQAEQPKPLLEPPARPASSPLESAGQPRTLTAGLRRLVTLSLFTGPTTEQELARALIWDLKRTREVVGSMLKQRLCYLTEHGRLCLTEEGKKQAVWHQANPHILAYRPRPTQVSLVLS